MVDLAADVPAGEPKLRIDKLADGAITCLKLSGTVDEAFEGKRLAATVRGGTLILDLGDVKKISSFGIREWVDFVGAAGEHVESILFVECAPKVVDQLNMVMNFAGAGRVFSFYAPYRCDYCDIERRVLLQVDRDRDAIRTLKPPERPCESCGNPAYFDEDPATFFSYLAGQPAFELEPEIAAFLATKLSYTVADGARRLRAEKHIEGRMTHLRLAGDLDATFPTTKVAEGLEGVVVVDLAGVGKIDPAGAAAWRGFLQVVPSTCEAIWLVACPPIFLERLARADDLGRARVVSFTMPYACPRCAATTSRIIEVDAHFDVLKFATAPEQKCPDCGGPTSCAASETLLAHLGALSKPEVPPEVSTFIAGEKKRKTVPAPAARPPAGRTGIGPILVAAALAAVIAAGVVVGWTALRARHAEVAGAPVGDLLARSVAARPSWITSSATAYGACGDAAAGVSCVGVSTYAATDATARTEAMDAALEAAVSRVGAGVPDAGWQRLVASVYGPARQQGLAEATGSGAQAGRNAVAAALRKTAAGVPAQPAAEYWERYAALPGASGNRTLSFVRIDLSAAELAALAARYTALEPAPKALGDAHAWTLFPGLAWRDGALRGGAELASVVSGPLRDAGLSAGDIVVEVEGKPVADAASFAAAAGVEEARLSETGGALHLTVKSGDAQPRTFTVTVPRARTAAAPVAPQREDRTAAPAGPVPTGGGVNIWDRTGGGNVRDNPNE